MLNNCREIARIVALSVVFVLMLYNYCVSSQIVLWLVAEHRKS